MNNCQPLPTDTPGIFRCPVCGLENPRPIKKPFVAQCGKQAEMQRLQEEAAERLAKETGDPSILSKIPHYGVALFRYAASGFKTRSKEEVARIYTEHCRPCERFDAEADACTICGCNVRVEGMAIRNKAAMATESCPEGNW